MIRRYAGSVDRDVEHGTNGGPATTPAFVPGSSVGNGDRRALVVNGGGSNASARPPVNAAAPPPKQGQLHRFCIILFAAASALIILAVIVTTAGVGGVNGNHVRALVIVAQGMKGSTVTLAINANKMPNLQRMSIEGVISNCTTPGMAGCVRTQSGPRGSPFGTWTSAPGIASILTGVNATKHHVYNDSSINQLNPAYSTFLKVLNNQQVAPAIIGSSSLFSLILDNRAVCTALGLVDIECFGPICPIGTSGATCNSGTRFAYQQSDADPSVLNAGLSAMAEGKPFVFVHLNGLEKAAMTPTGMYDYSIVNNRYLSQLYVADSIIGQLVEAAVLRTASAYNENWLVMVVSDHGGPSMASVNPPGMTPNDDEDAFLGISAYQSGFPLTLRPLTATPTVFDTFATLQTWFGWPASTLPIDGVVQGICSGGATPPISC